MSRLGSVGDGATVVDQLTGIIRSGEGKRGCCNQRGMSAGQAKTSLSCDIKSLAQFLENSKNSIDVRHGYH